MKRLLAITVMLVCLFFVATAISKVPVVDAYSDTQTIYPNCNGGFPLLELQAGDRLDVSFSLSNLGPYDVAFPDSYAISSHDAYYSVNISLGLGRECLLIFPNTKGDSFSYTALKHGYYAIDYYCEEGTRWIDPKNPVITVNYNITKVPTIAPTIPTLSSTIQPTPFSERQSETFSPVYIVGFFVAILLAIAVSIALLFRQRRKANAKPPKARGLEGEIHTIPTT